MGSRLKLATTGRRRVPPRCCSRATHVTVADAINPLLRTTRTIHLPCLDHYACHHMPWGNSAAVTTSAAPTERLAHPAHPVSMRSMTRRQVMARALSWVASGYEYKRYHSTESLAHRPTTHWHATRRMPAPRSATSATAPGWSAWLGAHCCRSRPLITFCCPRWPRPSHAKTCSQGTRS